MVSESIDKEDMKGVLEDFPEQCEQALALGREIKFSAKFDSVVICGMGGSAISGDLLRNVLGDIRIPIYTIRDYAVPKFLRSNTLAFIASYSGNTEETLAAYDDCRARGFRIVAISSGGKLEQECKERLTKHIRIPAGIQPRLATPFLFFPMLNVLRNAGIAKISDEEIGQAIKYLRKADVAGTAEGIAQKLKGKIPLVYSSPRFSAVAMKWKTDINENSKVHAFYNIYPEFNHNELNAYESQDRQFYAIIIRDEMEHRRISRRMQVTARLIKEKKVDFTEVMLRGDSMLRKVLSATYMGLWVGYFLAMEYGTNPTPVHIIEDLKRMLR